MSTYSRRPEHVAAGRAFLIEVRHRAESDLPTYGEFSAKYCGIPRAAAPVLNRIARDCADRGEPDLSVLVVNGETRLPGMVGSQPLSRDDEASLTRWRHELQRVRSFTWSDATR